jgi:FAD synthase
MGVPTANVAPLHVEMQFYGKPKGVYFGWAQVQAPGVAEDGIVAKMVLNYGVRPTIQDGSNVTVKTSLHHWLLCNTRRQWMSEDARDHLA